MIGILGIGFAFISSLLIYCGYLTFIALLILKLVSYTNIIHIENLYWFSIFHLSVIGTSIEITFVGIIFAVLSYLMVRFSNR